ncbi:Unknown protein sequence [Pseudomonas syringae pv. maculicola]|nr:Unknown protein sequence [Pseudomonas syringae pv. maculicola]
MALELKPDGGEQGRRKKSGAMAPDFSFRPLQTLDQRLT